MMRTEPVEYPAHGEGIQGLVPRVGACCAGRVLLGGDGLQVALVARLVPPVVYQLVPRHTDQPGRAEGDRVGPAYRVDRGEKRLGSQVLGERDATAAGEQVAVDVRQRVVVQPQQVLAPVHPSR